MSDDAGFNSVEAAAAPVDNSGGDSGGVNPAWTPIYEKIPTEFHNMIQPTLKEWDQNFQRVQSQFAPYKDYAEQGIAPDHINASLRLAKVLQENPRFVYDKMVEAYGEEWGLNSGQGVVEQGNPEENAFGENGQPAFNIEQHPMFQQMQQQMQAMTQVQQAQIEAQQRAQIDQEIENDFAAAATKYAGGERLSPQEMQMIGNIAIAQNIPVSKAADAFFSMYPRQQTSQAVNQLPNIVPPGGGMPSQAVNPAALSDKTTRATVAELLRAAAEQNN